MSTRKPISVRLDIPIYVMCAVAILVTGLTENAWWLMLALVLPMAFVWVAIAMFLVTRFDRKSVFTLSYKGRDIYKG